MPTIKFTQTSHVKHKVDWDGDCVWFIPFTLEVDGVEVINEEASDDSSKGWVIASAWEQISEYISEAYNSPEEEFMFRNETFQDSLEDAFQDFCGSVFYNFIRAGQGQADASVRLVTQFSLTDDMQLEEINNA